VLNWDNMPDPFRHYEGVPVLDLPADPSVPPIPALELLDNGIGCKGAPDGHALLSQLLFYSAAVSASKLVPSTGYRYALRVNPSSGNLHPTEFHFLARGIPGWPDGLFHYRPSSHMAEQRAAGDIDIGLGTGALTFVLTSIAWREAWKYRDRAYRYCLHDIGHAWQALALSARAAGYDSFATGYFPDDEITRSCKLSEDEWPMLVIEIREIAAGSELRGGATEWFGGVPNRLSSETVAYPLIEEMHEATKSTWGSELTGGSPEERVGDIVLPPPAASKRAFGEVSRARRSALDFHGGTGSISLAQLSAILSAGTQPLSADFAGTRFIRLYMYVHRVDGLQPGVYRYWPEHNGLEQIKSGDQRVAAAGLSLGQDLAGNACVAFSMVGDLGRATQLHGNRGYRYVHFEAGAIGQRLYLAAEALGLGATGIGAFFDDAVQRYLGLTSELGQVVYHFAIGYPVPDPRVTA